MNYLYTLGAFVVAIGALVIFHELGHYLVMRLCHVRVLRFAFGFGKTLWSFKDKSGTEWALCLWPLGGYVKPLDSRENRRLNSEERQLAFDTQSVWKRIAMVSAGPLANFLLAILLYWVVYINGIDEWRPILGQPPVDTPAAFAGVQAGDLVTRVDGEPVQSWSDVQWRLLKLLGHETAVTLAVVATDQGVPKADAQDRGVEIRLPQDQPVDPALLQSLGLKLETLKLIPRIGEVQPASAATAAGLLTGDLVKTVNDQAITDWAQFVQMIRSHPDQPLSLQIERDGQMLSLTLIPASLNEQGQMIGRAGIMPQSEGQFAAFKIHRTLSMDAALQAAVTETYEKSRFTLVMMGEMLVGKASLDNLSGPVTIASAAGQTARMGWEHFLKFLAIVSLSLGVINLLPLPLLDGGHLMYYFTEIITGKPVSVARQMMLQRVGIALLGSLMFIALFNDLQRLFNW